MMKTFNTNMHNQCYNNISNIPAAMGKVYTNTLKYKLDSVVLR